MNVTLRTEFEHEHCDWTGVKIVIRPYCIRPSFLSFAKAVYASAVTKTLKYLLIPCSKSKGPSLERLFRNRFQSLEFVCSTGISPRPRDFTPDFNFDGAELVVSIFEIVL
jgi:hypothetical protein